MQRKFNEEQKKKYLQIPSYVDNEVIQISLFF